MPKVITTLQAMSHPTVVATINVLSEMSQRLQDENDELKKPWVGLTDEEIEMGRDQTFSTNNPYCPCDSKTMRKAVRWAEAQLKEYNT